MVIPSLPGIGFLGPPPDRLDLSAVAQASVGLMDRLGYERYAVQGADRGWRVAGIRR